MFKNEQKTHFGVFFSERFVLKSILLQEGVSNSAYGTTSFKTKIH